MSARPKYTPAHTCALCIILAVAATLLGAASVLLGFDDLPFGWVILRVVIGLVAFGMICFAIAYLSHFVRELTRE